MTISTFHYHPNYHLNTTYNLYRECLYLRTLWMSGLPMSNLLTVRHGRVKYLLIEVKQLKLFEFVISTVTIWKILALLLKSFVWTTVLYMSFSVFLLYNRLFLNFFLFKALAFSDSFEMLITVYIVVSLD